MVNISKKRKWFDNVYDVYYLSKKELGNYVNVWFPSSDITVKKKKYIIDTLWTIKRCDKKTSYSLYNKIYNPVCFRIMESYRYEKVVNKWKYVKKESFDLKALIYSIDDSSFGIMFMSKTYEELSIIRDKMMRWVDSHSEINGHEFIEACIEMGADGDTVDYN